MRNRLLTLLTLAAFARVSVAERRFIPCKTPEIAKSCFVMHGRLAVYNGGPPNLRLWQVGSDHLFGIYSGKLGMQNPGPLYDYNDAFGSPQVPHNVQAAFWENNAFGVSLYADFQVCPLEPRTPGRMQAACIESATNLFVKKD